MVDDRPGHGVRYFLDPADVTIIRDPEGEVIIGYVWEPAGPVPRPVTTTNWPNKSLIEQAPESRRARRRRLGLRWWQPDPPANWMDGRGR